MGEKIKPENPNVYPDPIRSGDSKLIQNPWNFPQGMKLRDHFAGLAMQSLLNQKHYDGQQLYELNEDRFIISHFDITVTEEEIQKAKESVIEQARYVAERAYLMADAMLEQRLKED